MQSVISERDKLLGSSLFSKSSKFDLDFKTLEKNWEKFVFKTIVSELLALHGSY